jgi:DivIVA domain-containing protein
LTTTAWFDEQTRMDAEDLLTVSFPLTRPGRRGYDEQSVREFLQTVHAEYVRLVDERTSLWQDVQRLRRRIIFGRAVGARKGGPAREAQRHMDIVLEEAHASAHEAAVSALSAPPSPQAEHQHQAAHAELAYLRAYGGVWRAHLKAYTEGILHGIEDWERKDAAAFDEVEHGPPVRALLAADDSP